MRALACAGLLSLFTTLGAAQIVVDNSDAGFTRSGFDQTGAFGSPFGSDYRVGTGTGGAATETARWTFNVPEAGTYDVETWYVSGANRVQDAPYTVVHANGSQTVDINQEANGGQWVYIGTYDFNAGTGGYVELSNACQLNEAVIADAVRLVPFTPPPVGGDEIRGVWQSRFQWASGNPNTARANLTGVMDNMVNHHFNTVFLQMRGACDTLYPSPNEPWSPLVTSPDGIDPGWDPAAFAVSAAHSRGLQVHAYINTHTCWESSSPPTYAMNANSSIGRHVFWDHANPNDPNARDWLLYDNAGNPTGFDEYYWFNPGVPAMDAYVREQVMHVVNTYDFDGVHFDRIRMTDPNYGRNPIAVARWDNPGTGTPNDGPGNPDRLAWAAFMRDAVTRAAVNITGEAWLIDPTVVVSSAPLGLYDSSAYPGYPGGFFYGYPRAQDAKAWMQLGAMDFIVPQIYWPDGGNLPDFSDLYLDWQAAANAAGRQVVPGSHNGLSGQSGVESQALIARANGAAGHNLWHSGSTNWSQWSESGGPYESIANVPTFPWRTTEGVICGRVYEADASTPITDAWLNRAGVTWTALSSADGFYAFLRVPPGTHSITAMHPDHGEVTVGNITVVGGQATEVDIVFGGDTPVGISLRGVE